MKITNIYIKAQSNKKLYQIASDRINHSIRFRNAAYRELKKRDSKSANMARYGQLKKPSRRKSKGMFRIGGYKFG